MARVRRPKNEADQRMFLAASKGQVFLPEKDIRALTRANLDYWISELRKGEAMTRQLRKRLEALRDQSERSCPVCARPVAGRPDAVYCGPACRIKAHREAKKTATTEGVTTAGAE